MLTENNTFSVEIQTSSLVLWNFVVDYFHFLRIRNFYAWEVVFRNLVLVYFGFWGHQNVNARFVAVVDFVFLKKTTRIVPNIDAAASASVDVVALSHYSALLAGSHDSTSNWATDPVLHESWVASRIAKNYGSTLRLHIAFFYCHFALLNVNSKFVFAGEIVSVSTAISVVVKASMGYRWGLRTVAIVAWIALAATSIWRTVLLFFFLLWNLSSSWKWITLSRIYPADSEAFDETSFALSSASDNVVMAWS